MTCNVELETKEINSTKTNNKNSQNEYRDCWFKSKMMKNSETFQNMLSSAKKQKKNEDLRGFNLCIKIRIKVSVGDLYGIVWIVCVCANVSVTLQSLRAIHFGMLKAFATLAINIYMVWPQCGP